ncbi:MAG TPA: transcription elongation factor GreA [Gammaproteobacteria bacterium]|nr:transcription elongation factor GreA [Gammaproteobacteria bacterium]HQZ88145.1 transcription elongation factor GreA [Gammaproteobacteria bacterium]
MQQIPMTATGVEKLREELKHLKNVVRPRIIAAIAEARGHGDLKENAEYHAAKEQQAFTEGRIRDIEHKLSYVQVIDLTGMANNGKVVFSATVTLLNLDTDQTMVYQIVGEEEADLKTGKISVTSPIARAVIGKYKGDTVEVTAPGGVVSYEVSEVIY